MSKPAEKKRELGLKILDLEAQYSKTQEKIYALRQKIDELRAEYMKG